ncbi:hypothetical protein JKP88DRAFT_270922 [Tribonema minus]|uniref:Ubiquitin-like domain-containing protein n=1 Tax=Tribonema minus TaxID=303371 RepID=A0A835YIE5_9STRA|nr:hypothetical protein JKP88DRAFT_270922 [Tribonema minus]
MGCSSSRNQAADQQSETTHGTTDGPVGRASKRITKGPPWKYGSVVTQQQLVDMRQEYFATRVEGHSYVWQVIKAACEALLEGDEELANSIMEASAVICPTGVMTLCYDDSGLEYRVPKYCFRNPEDMRSTMDEARALQGHVAAVLEPGESITLKMQVAPIERKFDVGASSNMTVVQLKQALCDHIETLTGDASEKPHGVHPFNQRIIYCGRELPDSKTLAELNVSPDFVLQVYVRRKIVV